MSASSTKRAVLRGMNVYNVRQLRANATRSDEQVTTTAHALTARGVRSVKLNVGLDPTSAVFATAHLPRLCAQMVGSGVEFRAVSAESPAIELKFADKTSKTVDLSSSKSPLDVWAKLTAATF
ncbi:hypothetical protein HDU81_003620 [Chytriomyces hyalinus]|nr:hypothetical protein HDU81_003620 [Chytriomyces hyalinus]